jgi:hypothetical protein
MPLRVGEWFTVAPEPVKAGLDQLVLPRAESLAASPSAPSLLDVTRVLGRLLKRGGGGHRASMTKDQEQLARLPSVTSLMMTRMDLTEVEDAEPSLLPVAHALPRAFFDGGRPGPAGDSDETLAWRLLRQAMQLSAAEQEPEFLTAAWRLRGGLLAMLSWQRLMVVQPTDGQCIWSGPLHLVRNVEIGEDLSIVITHEDGRAPVRAAPLRRREYSLTAVDAQHTLELDGADVQAAAALLLRAVTLGRAPPYLLVGTRTAGGLRDRSSGPLLGGQVDESRGWRVRSRACDACVCSALTSPPPCGLHACRSLSPPSISTHHSSRHRK